MFIVSSWRPTCALLFDGVLVLRARRLRTQGMDMAKDGMRLAKWGVPAVFFGEPAPTLMICAVQQQSSPCNTSHVCSIAVCVRRPSSVDGRGVHAL